MTDEEVEQLLPAVEEFVTAVKSRNPDHVAVCFMYLPAETFAVVLAELLDTARADLAYARDRIEDTAVARRALGEAHAVNRALRARLEKAEAQVVELREMFYRREKRVA